MKLMSLLLGCLLLSGGTVFAGEHEALAEELLVLNGTKKMIEQMPENINLNNTMMMKKSVSGAILSPEALAEHQKEVMLLAGKYFNWESVKKDYIEMYTDTYSVDDLKAIIAFMKSPVGTKMREKTPELGKRSNAYLEGKGKKAMAEIFAISRSFIMKAKADKAKADEKAKEEKAKADDKTKVDDKAKTTAPAVKK